MKIHITNFVRRQNPQSPFSHWTLTDKELISAVNINMSLGNVKPGYRDGVILVSLDPVGFFTGVCKLKPGDKLIGEYKSRKEGEDPRKSSYVVGGEKIPAKSAYAVIYSHAVLLEGKENESDDADYEIVSINASPTVEDTPIPVGSLIANHLGLSGGTATKMTDEEFVKMLRVSVEFWKDKANACPHGLCGDIGAEILANLKSTARKLPVLY